MSFISTYMSGLWAMRPRACTHSIPHIVKHEARISRQSIHPSSRQDNPGHQADVTSRKHIHWGRFRGLQKPWGKSSLVSFRRKLVLKYQSQRNSAVESPKETCRVALAHANRGRMPVFLSSPSTTHRPPARSVYPSYLVRVWTFLLGRAFILQLPQSLNRGRISSSSVCDITRCLA